MKVKKYTANSMHEAMKVIRSELGDDAVILNSKEVDVGGFLGFFTKKQIEVIAAIDPTVIRAPIRKQDHSISRSRQAHAPSQVQSKKESTNQAHLMKEINQLKELIQGMNDNKPIQKDYPEPFQEMDDQLRTQGVTDTIRLKIMKHMMKQWYEQTAPERNKEAIKKDLYTYLQELLSKVPIGGIAFDKKIINIVGPTGVGKTTTIAKLAAHCVLKKQKKVALITTDTYRIAAVDQLRTYAKILNIPLEVAYSIEDFKKAIEQFQHYDLILVDSAGRNFQNKLYVDELSKVIDFEQDATTYLVLSLTSKYEDMKNIINQFSLIPLDQVILTKQDETSSYGAILNIPIDLDKGFAYITTGQNVPDDIVEATIKYLLDSVLEVSKYE
ncbi:flagellar biosynthesis protein FlhF [Alkalihalobacillus sp. MEB130]|uniref:flagellar biosynthesis protein FlhF n=1 Tax=Alkalihalobacillus sp. MEB130 TaxID=2976704 RepID=UPI0028DE8553|nr:flagellar biosynthesis protein FlhF [Alkalihalobacillus sp. MEB130]MDT8859008.1 flagellar biosynthesis protein FlhF [Alkalihalobacillus sp. MEB130]